MENEGGGGDPGPLQLCSCQGSLAPLFLHSFWHMELPFSVSSCCHSHYVYMAGKGNQTPSSCPAWLPFPTLQSLDKTSFHSTPGFKKVSRVRYLFQISQSSMMVGLLFLLLASSFFVLKFILWSQNYPRTPLKAVGKRRDWFSCFSVHWHIPYLSQCLFACF
jgi:hypothetical protein